MSLTLGDDLFPEAPGRPRGGTLANLYRPRRFSDVFGQPCVPFLKAGIATGRLGCGIVFTGIQGIGKTTLARLVARALNCLERGEDGEPCGQCRCCRAGEDTGDFDTIEIDAASHTGVDDMRELIENARYRPLGGAFKVFIIDEAHMLSKSAFNALLKTLEEPPPHVKFIMATTEARKIPLTILSRCLRFDLRPFDLPLLVQHLTLICAREGIQAEEEAIRLMARAAEGSARDGLSILGQAALGIEEGGVLSADLVRRMLGILRQDQIDLILEAVLSGEAPAVLQAAEALLGEGIDPIFLLRGLLEAFFEAMRAAAQGGASVQEDTLHRLWQMTLQGLEDVRAAPCADQALMMVLLRLVHARTLPSTQSLLKGITMPTRPSGPSAPASFEAVMALLSEKREVLLHAGLAEHARLYRFAVGKIELSLTPGASSTLVPSLKAFLDKQTGLSWEVILRAEGGAPTLHEQQQNLHKKKEDAVRQDPLVQEALGLFPGSHIVSITEGKKNAL